MCPFGLIPSHSGDDLISKFFFYNTTSNSHNNTYITQQNNTNDTIPRHNNTTIAQQNNTNITLNKQLALTKLNSDHNNTTITRHNKTIITPNKHLALTKLNSNHNTNTSQTQHPKEHVSSLNNTDVAPSASFLNHKDVSPFASSLNNTDVGPSASSLYNTDVTPSAFSSLNNRDVINSSTAPPLDYVMAPDIRSSYNPKDHFSVLYINIRSLNKNFHRLRSLLQELSFRPHIIAISETWLSKDKEFIYELVGYTFINEPCRGRAGGSGLFIRHGIQYEHLKKLNLELENCDDIWVELTLYKNKKLIIGNIYRNPSPKFDTFQTKFSDTIDKLINQNISFIIGGDLNIDLFRDKDHLNFKDQIKSLGIRQTVICPTRITWKSKLTLLDHIYTSILEQETDTKTISFEISDHLPNIIFTKAFKFQKPSKNQQWIRNDKKLESDKFLKDLHTNLETMLGKAQSANDMWNTFIRTFNSTLNTHAPLRPLSKREKKLQQHPWITKDLNAAIKRKQQLYKKILSKPNRDKSKWNAYKKYRNKTSREIEIAKQLYYKTKIKASNSNPKKLWNTLNNIVKINKTKTIEDITILNEKGIPILDKSKISNTFNTYFTNIGVQLSKKNSVITSNNENNLCVKCQKLYPNILSQSHYRD